MQELFFQEVRNGMEGINKFSPDLWEMIVSFGYGDLYSRIKKSSRRFSISVALSFSRPNNYPNKKNQDILMSWLL